VLTVLGWGTTRRQDLRPNSPRPPTPVALRRGVSGSWIDLKLELWRVLSEAVEKGESRSVECFGEFEE
jgi:hypothetical protein